MTASRKGASRQISMIFFVGNSKTRSFSCGIRLAKIGLWCLALLLSWSVASVYILRHFYQSENNLRDQLYTAKERIFAYQTRYEGAFTAVYNGIQSQRQTSKNDNQEKSSESGRNVGPEKQQITRKQQPLGNNTRG